MTSPQVIQQIEAAGGFLAPRGDKIAYDVPKAAAALLEVVREHREEVLQILRERQDGAKHQIFRWMTACCAVPKNPAKAWGAEKFLYRGDADWCRRAGQPVVSTALFAGILGESFTRDADGWQGLCLAEDWRASKGLAGRPAYPKATERGKG